MAGHECQTLGILATDNHAPDNQIIIVSDFGRVKYSGIHLSIRQQGPNNYSDAGARPRLIYWVGLHGIS